MPSTPPLPMNAQNFTRDSINTVKITGSVDGSGTLETSANTTWYATISDWATGTIIQAQTLMTYTGTAGSWSIDIAATVWGTPYDSRLVTMQQYDQNGNVGSIRLTQFMIANDRP